MVEPFEQIAIPFQQNIGQAVSEKLFKIYTILYIYIAQGQGQIIPRDKILIVTKRVCYFDQTL